MAGTAHVLPFLDGSHDPDGAPRRRRRSLAVLAAALLGALAIAGAASAATPVTVDPTPGYTAPAGMVRDAHGDLWVSDSHGGVCRLIEPNFGPSALDITNFCDPAALVRPLGGPLAPGQMAFDPVSSNFFVGDSASGFGSVWRLHLDQSVTPSAIDTATKMLDFSGLLVKDRVFGMSYHAGLDELAFTTKNSPNIQRIVGPATCAPCAPSVLGSAGTKAVPSIAHGADGTLYIADIGGVTAIRPSAFPDTAAHPVPGLAGTYTALAFDANHDGGRLLAGTTNVDSADWIDILQVSTGQTATFAAGFAGVTAIASDVDGRLDVADDFCTKQVCEDARGNGSLWTVPYEAFVPPPTIVDGPASITDKSAVTLYFTHPTASVFYCSLDDAAPVACGAGPQSLKTYTGLADGAHVFQVQADDLVTGPRARRRFSVDTHAPVVTIDAVQVAGTSADIAFSSDELNVNYSCRLDGRAPFPCDAPTSLSGLAHGVHTFSVQPSDFVGNLGASAATAFRIGPAPKSWRPGRVTATLAGRTLRVVFNAPPDARFARFTITKRPVYPVRTKLIAIRAGKRNVVRIVLSRVAAQRLQSKHFTLRIEAGATRKVLAGAGRTTLLVKAPLS